MGDFTWHDGKGGIFSNDKGDNPDRPDVRGNCTVHGKPMEISGWWREGKNGKWLSVAIQAARQHSVAQPGQPDVHEPAPGGQMSRADAMAQHGGADPSVANKHAPVQTEPDRKPAAGFDDDIPF